MELTKRQKTVLEKIYDFMSRNSYPPSVRDVAENMGFSSPRAASDHIKALEKKGYVARNSLARSLRLTEKAIKVLISAPLAGEPGGSKTYGNPYKENREFSPIHSFAVLGRIAAGSPILAQENIEEYISVPESFLKAYGADFALRVKGDSMTGDHILEGDIIMVRSQDTAQSGDVVAVLLGEEATVKRFYGAGGGTELRSSNPDYPPIKIGPGKNRSTADLNFRILGKVVAVYRNM
jgi:repressor LexA